MESGDVVEEVGDNWGADNFLVRARKELARAYVDGTESVTEDDAVPDVKAGIGDGSRGS